MTHPPTAPRLAPRLAPSTKHAPLLPMPSTLKQLTMLDCENAQTNELKLNTESNRVGFEDLLLPPSAFVLDCTRTKKRARFTSVDMEAHIEPTIKIHSKGKSSMMDASAVSPTEAASVISTAYDISSIMNSPSRRMSLAPRQLTSSWDDFVNELMSPHIRSFVEDCGSFHCVKRRVQIYVECEAPCLQ